MSPRTRTPRKSAAQLAAETQAEVDAKAAISAETSEEDSAEESLPTETLVTVDPVELAAAVIQERIKPLIAAAFEAESDSALKTEPVALEVISLMRLYDEGTDENPLPVWSRKRLPAAFGLHLDSFYNSAVEIPSELDLGKAAERERSLTILAALRKRVDNALYGPQGKGLIQQAIVTFCESRMDPEYTLADFAARRWVDAAGKYVNYKTLPSHLVALIHAEYLRNPELKLPANLGGGQSGRNPQAAQTGPSKVAVTTTLKTVTENVTNKAGQPGGSSLQSVVEETRKLVGAIFARTAYLLDSGVEINDKDKIAIDMALIEEAADAVTRMMLGNITAAHRAEVAQHFGIDIGKNPVAPITDGVDTGAEPTTDGTTELPGDAPVPAEAATT